jgi:hypothetical protein
MAQNATLTIVGCWFQGCVAKSEGGGAVAVYSSYLSIVGCSFVASSAGYGGGVAAVGNTSAYISSSSFEQCTARGFSGGGAFVRNSTVSINNCTFLESSANLAGGVVMADHHATTHILLSYFLQCWAGEEGGGVASQTSLVNVTGCSFDGNVAARGGCVGGSFGSNVSIVTSNFSFCTAGTSGGGVDQRDGVMVIRGSSFLENSCSPGLGGAVASGGGNTSIMQSSFNSCYGGCGGALYVQGGVPNASVTVLQVSTAIALPHRAAAFAQRLLKTHG